MFVDYPDFHVDALEKFVEEATVPIVNLFNKDPTNHPFVIKFFNNPLAKAMMFIHFDAENFEAFKLEYHTVASNNSGNGIGCLLGDVAAAQGAFQYFGRKEDQVPLIIIQQEEGQIFFKAKLKPDHIASGLEAYTEGKLEPFQKSKPIPEFNSELVKFFVADSLLERVLNSWKNVLLERREPVSNVKDAFVLYGSTISAETTTGSAAILVFDFLWYEPSSERIENMAAAQRARDFHLGWVLEPNRFGHYPRSMELIVEEWAQQICWAKSDWKNDDGMSGDWVHTSGTWSGDPNDKGIKTSPDYRFFAISSQFLEISNKDKTLVFQFSVTHEQKLDCGGGYMKLLSRLNGKVGASALT
ncbi:protein disulfide-isomerase-like [Aristolochia californica]|uniref:protein disulfide-isomerase-like n=1 Tax=Aristolochia californica TaxID=171875 RepID=UPI0035DB12DC